MTPLERHCGWLLRAYPAWYRRERSGEMLGTLLEASLPGRRWPSFRDARALVTGGMRVRGWTWVLSVLWVGAGAVMTGYFFYNSTKPFTLADVTSGTDFEGLSAAPAAVQVAVNLAHVAFLVLPVPVLIAGFIRLRGWRRGNWLRAAAWAGTWIAGDALLAGAQTWGLYPEQSCPNSYTQVCPIPSPAVVSWGELAVCAAWLVLGVAMTWILAVPARRSELPGTSIRGSGKASRRPAGARDLRT